MFTKRRLLAGLVVVLLAGAGGTAGYVLGDPSGGGLSEARLAGARAGEVQGADRGSQDGYDEGFKAGFRHGKVKGYRTAYYKLLDKAGVQAPELTSGRGKSRGGGFD